jgi:hypothetical protein
MSENLVKSLTQLIDETLSEIETLKKGRFDPAMIDLADDKANGSVDTTTVNKAEEDEDKKEDDEKEEDEVVEKKEEDKEEDEDEEDEDEEFKKAEEAYKAACAKRDMKKAEKDGVNVEKMEEVKKSIDARVSPLEAKLEEISTLVKKLADAPVGARGHTFMNVQPLAKSQDGGEPLSKAMVLEKLIDLQKTGRDVTNDVIRAEMGGDLNEIANKYGLK